MKVVIFNPPLAVLLIHRLQGSSRQWKKFFSSLCDTPVELPFFTAEVIMPVKCNLLPQKITLAFGNEKAIENYSYQKSKHLWQKHIINALRSY